MVEAYSICGEQVYSEIFYNQISVNIMLSLPKGIYQVRVETNAGVLNKKIVIQ